VLEAEAGREDNDRVCDQCHEVAEVFLIHHHVRHKHEQREEEVVDELESEKNSQVQPELEVEIAHHHLTEHSRHRQECHPHDEDEPETQEFPHEEDPVRHRRRVGDLAQPGVSLPPHELAGIEHNEQRDQHQGGPGMAGDRAGQNGDDGRCSGKQRNSRQLLDRGHQQRQERREGGPQHEAGGTLRDRRERRPGNGERLPGVGLEAELSHALVNGDRTAHRVFTAWSAKRNRR